MEVVAQGSWSWTLVRQADRYFLEVLCGTVGLYTIQIELGRSEVNRYLAEGLASIDELAREIVQAPESRSSIEAKAIFEAPEAAEAIPCWREAQDRENTGGLPAA